MNRLRWTAGDGMGFREDRPAHLAPPPGATTYRRVAESVEQYWLAPASPGWGTVQATTESP